MPSLDEVYRKFGEASEAAQLLEMKMGQLLLLHKCIEAGLLEDSNPNREAAIEKQINNYKQIYKLTLGKMMRSLGLSKDSTEGLEQLLNVAFASRNRLTHSFYLHHNFRRYSDDGRDVMLCDLQAIHDDLLEAHKALWLLSGAGRNDQLEPGTSTRTDHLQIPT